MLGERGNRSSHIRKGYRRCGAKNLGGLISREFANGGAKIVVHYNSHATKPEAEATVQAIKSLGTEAYAAQGDLTKPFNVAALFEQAKRRFGGVDIAINTVGKVLRKPIVDTTEEEYDSMFEARFKPGGRNRSRSARIVLLIPRGPSADWTDQGAKDNTTDEVEFRCFFSELADGDKEEISRWVYS